MFGQQRSNSGPSGLSINTNSANTFNNANKPPQSGGLLGSTAGGLFGSSTTSNPQAGTLFGSSASKPSQPSGLFGALPTGNTPSAAGTLFGASTSSPGGGMFGQTKPQQQSTGGGLFGTPSTQTGSIFGKQGASLAPPSNTQQTQQQQSGGLFGSLGQGSQNQTQQPQQQQAGGLFGSMGQAQSQSQAQQPQQQQAGGLFGSLGQIQSQIQPQQPQQQPQQSLGGGLFGSLGQSQLQNPGQQTQSRPSLFGSSLSNFGNSQQRPSLGSLSQPQQTQRSMFSGTIGQYSQQQQTIPGVRVDLSNLRPTTRFNDLYEEVQKIIENVDNFILTQIHFEEECEQVVPTVADTLEYMPRDTGLCFRKLEAIQQSLENDAEAVDSLKTMVKSDAADARLSFKAIQNLRMPQQFHHTSLWNMPGPQSVGRDEPDGENADLVSYFSRQTDDMTRKLESFQRNIAEVESYLRGVESNTIEQVQRVEFSQATDGGERSADDQVRELAAVLREFENGIMAVGGKVAGARQQVHEVMLGEGTGRRRRVENTY